jgi:hypothetical protein
MPKKAASKLPESAVKKAATAKAQAAAADATATAAKANRKANRRTAFKHAAAYVKEYKQKENEEVRSQPPGPSDSASLAAFGAAWAQADS